MKILNLYAGVGGNRQFWSNVEVTAVEHNPEIATVYSDLYPSDTVIITDAHQYLLEHFAEFDFIWASPPCPTHGQYRYNVGVRAKGYKPVYPDMTLYEEIIFLKHHHRGLWVVENVKPYYEPLIEAQKLGRHYFWANFTIGDFDVPPNKIRSANKIEELESLVGISLTKYKIANKRQILRNCTNGHLGNHVLKCAQASVAEMVKAQH